MTSNFIELELIPNKYGGGSFECEACFRLDNFKTLFKNIKVKIDTGCAISTIPVKKLKVSSAVCEKLKCIDIDNQTISIRSYGVETGGLKHSEPITRQQKIQCEALKFQHGISDLQLNGVKVPSKSIFLNYNRSGNILIGMDILSLMMCHIDISQKTGKLTLLCCPRESANDDFYIAMKEHFGLIRIQ